MKIKNSYPPNYQEIKVLNPPKEAIYAYGDTIYNPSGGEIYQDLVVHEEVHKIQQGDSPEMWWNRYLIDKDFRLKQEAEAYHAQYLFCKKIMTNKDLKLALADMTKALTQTYGLELSYSEAETMIRKFSLAS